MVLINWGGRDAWSSAPQLMSYVTDLLVVDLQLSLANFMMTHPVPIAGKLPIKLWFLGNYQQNVVCVYMYTQIVHLCTHLHTLGVAYNSCNWTLYPYARRCAHTYMYNMYAQKISIKFIVHTMYMYMYKIRRLTPVVFCDKGAFDDVHDFVIVGPFWQSVMNSTNMQVPETLEIGLVPMLKRGQYPGLFLFSNPARMVRPVINLATNVTEMIGSFEQVHLPAIRVNYCEQCLNGIVVAWGQQAPPWLA